MYTQVKPLTEEELKSMVKYNLGEFLYPYKKAKGNYNYITSITDKDTLSLLFDMIIMFLK